MAHKRVETGRRPSPGVVTSSKTGSKKAFYVSIAVIAIGGIAALSYTASRSKAVPPITLNPNLPPVTSEGYVIGSPSAPLEVIEFGDFECPTCGRFAELVEPDVRSQLVNTGKIRFRYIDFPLVNLHRNTLNAAVAAACADEQGQFWPLHDLLFARQDEWNSEATSDPDKVIKSLTRQIPAIDASKFDQCLDSRRTLGKVQTHLKLAEARQINGTPTFIIGNKQYEFMGIDEFKKAVNEAIAAQDSSKTSSSPTTKKTTKKS
jgi:protein-disulfide isomerase